MELALVHLSSDLYYICVNIRYTIRLTAFANGYCLI